jgi:hypothetical protein
MQISIRQRWEIPMAQETLPLSITSDISKVQAGIVGVSGAETRDKTYR